MKKILLMSALVTAVLFAAGDKKEDAATVKMHRVQTMQNLEVAMATLQKGFLYNNTALVKEGITKLKFNIQDVKDFEVENDKDKKFDASSYAKAEIGAISKLADGMLKDFEGGSKEKVLAGFQKTLNQCVTCHLIVRKW